MRKVRVSKTALDQLNALLAQGIEPFGVRVVAEKRDRVYATIEHVLAAFPAIKRPHPNLGLCVYPIARTPFVVLYNFDDSRAFHFSSPRRFARSRSNIDPVVV